MANNLSLSEVNNLLKNDHINLENSFSIIKSIASNINNSNNYFLQEIILRVIEKKSEFLAYKSVINDFARAIGLFPYLDPSELSLPDRIAYEFHRPIGENESIVFHRAQARVYFEILDGRNVILSAPTSFGKSLIIDSLLSSNKFRNIVIVLPTIALIDETRKRLSKFKSSYKIITHTTQQIEEKNIFILTQERVIDVVNDNNVDFFVIDEFYKIHSTEVDQDRSMILNQAFYKLLKKGGQFYLLGPNIENINNNVFPSNVDYTFIKTDYRTVITEKINVKVEISEEETLLNLCSSLKESTLIYCASPKSANRVARLLFESNRFALDNTNEDAVEWLQEEYHPLWYLPKAIQYGIGIHHGKVPRSISQYILKLFNEDKLQFLVCTSTLIEGINTKAKNVIIYDNKIAQEKFDYFTFNNICGRSGRMFQHFIGKVFLFHEQPTEELPLVDFPLFSQTKSVSSSLLMQMEEDDLSEESKVRIQKFIDNRVLSIDTIKANSNIDPESQINLAQYIRDNYRELYVNLKWNAFPEYKQLKAVCEIIWEYFNIRSTNSLVTSGSQLAFRLNRVRVNRNIKLIINEVVGNEIDSEIINDNIEKVLDFIRTWCQFNFPKYLLALNNIQDEIFKELELSPGDYSFFAAQVECLFTDPMFTALDEYGIPLQTSDKLKYQLDLNGNLDNLLLQLKNMYTENMDISPFERDLINEAKTYF